ncbi:MAG TPA: DHA2 family efflux MFS transporter permease subunit [Rhizomicrobium sp.]|jgi:EmrB/QacA subfamily drug resistance transporter
MSKAATPNANWILAATILASSLAFVDGSVINVGLPAMAATFKADAADLQWVVNGYLLPLSALLLLGGAAGDRFGRARLLIIGTAMFGLASLLCALAPSLFWLLAGRILQGIGSALLMPNSLAILGNTFSGEDRGRAIGIWAAMGAAMAAIGPVLGGWLIDHAGWRAIFFINLPLVIGAVALTAIFVREQRPPNIQPLDWFGGLLATAALGAITWGLTIGSGRDGWTAQAIVAAVGGIALMFGFLFAEQRKATSAMMPLAMFSSATFVGLSLLTLLLYGGLGALLVVLPYVLIRAVGYTGTQAGSSLVPFAIIVALASPMMGKLAGRIGSRLPLSIGPLIVAAGFLLALRIDAQADYWTTIFPAIVMIAIGMAGAVAPLTDAILGSVDAEHTAAASGLNSALARTGGLVATALLGSVLGASGAGLVAGFHVVAIACAVASLLAGASAFFLVSAS